MIRRLPVLLPLCLLLVAVASARAQGTPAPRISFEESAVVASGLPAGEKVVWLGVESRVDEEYSRELVRRYDLGTVAADGTARLELERPAARRSVWFVVEQRTGEFAMAAPEGYRIARAETPPRLGLGESAQPDGILDQRTYVVGLVVRPGEGAWFFSGGDGGDHDEDAAPGRLRFALDRLDPMPGSPAPPAKVGSSDLWLTVDPLRMEISVNKGGVAQ
jgi:hypothetical protein